MTSSLPPHRLFPDYTPGERRADLGFHIAGLALAAVGVPLLMIVGTSGSDIGGTIGLALYAAGLVAMLSFSASYNLARAIRAKEVLRRFDRAAIFVMIAGTYSPFALAKIGGVTGAGLFALLWTLALVGAALALFFPRRSDRIALGMYLGMGWSILLAAGPLVEAVPAHVLALLVAGGLVYTGGVAVHLARGVRYHNAIWHGCVLAAAGCHYAAVLMSFAPSAA